MSFYVDLNNIRDVVLIVTPTVLAGMRLWPRVKPVMASVTNKYKRWITRPIAEELEIVKEDIDDIKVHVDALERTQ